MLALFLFAALRRLCFAAPSSFTRLAAVVAVPCKQIASLRAGSATGLLGRLSEGPCGEIDLGLIPGVGVGATVRNPSKLDLQVQVVNASTVSGG